MTGNGKQKVCFVVGTRPEFIKMSPLFFECRRKKIPFFILHTGQHYSGNLDEIFFKELGLPAPKYNLKIGSGTHAETTGKALIGIEAVLKKEKPAIVFVEGDTDSVLAGALAAVKSKIKVGHIEAGLRSYFREMPEETNRILVDHCSDFLFAPTRNSASILFKEGIGKNKVLVTGNTIVDALKRNKKLANEKSGILARLDLRKGRYFLATAHREENVDDRARLKGILQGLSLVGKKFDSPVIFSVHPRTKKKIKDFHLSQFASGITFIEPVGYLDFIELESNAKLILTDSGGVQEEACILRIPCLTLRDNTERPETVSVGANKLVGADADKILKGAGVMLNKKRDWQNPFGTGTAAQKIITFCLKQ